VVYRQGMCDKSKDILLVPKDKMKVKEWLVSLGEDKDVHMDYNRKHTVLSFASNDDAQYS